MAMPPVPPVRHATASDGTRIAYMRYPGESPPFLSINTPGGPPIALKATMEVYAPRIAAFARPRQFVIFDWRGTGMSGPIRGSLSFDDLIDDLGAVTAAIGEPVDAWVGHGAACLPALAHAAQAPERYRSLWLRGPSVRSTDSSQARMNRSGWEQDYREHLRSILRLYSDVSNAEAASLAPLWEDGVPQSVFAAYMAAQERVDLTDTLPAIAIPAWVTAERPADMEPASRVAELLQDATISTWEPMTYTGDQGAWLRDEWDRNMGSRLGLLARVSVEGNESLSPRETDVLRLVAAGRTNAEVASDLTLSVRTVERHLENIYRKTGAANRAAAAAWATRQGLA